eukprot:CAMPEP_0185035904 /NCGR_PEP_ID=MMETSP1103-20130426/28033_1 /TAXON_ID=36769 /ORGANISM="Paraphysomonas bandaiensis, Strain Caron Lab Isolate" /LENGTH=606 /DNA_ID=CAMNT_0027573189 /DNA_START=98 /DNA_END=1915 /DNA_ORIENTATION=-
MVLTPKFSVSQSDDCVVVKIFVPYIRVSDAEIIADGTEFTFFCKPYLLKLSLPSEVEEDERCSAKYDPEEENGVIIATLPKKNKGEYFPGLDLSSQLMLRRKLKDDSTYSFPSIEVVSETTNDNPTDSADVEVGMGESISESNDLETPNISLGCNTYGFNQRYSGVLNDLRDELVDMISVRCPDSVPYRERRILRLQAEGVDFNEDRYIGDWIEGENDAIYIESMAYTAPWDMYWEQLKVHHSTASGPSESPLGPPSATEPVSSSACESDSVTTALPPSAESEPPLSVVEDQREASVFDAIGGYSDDEQETQRKLPRRSYLIPSSSAEERSVLLSLVDILFAYAYDCRTTQGEPTVESAYTISRVSPSLSWLEYYEVRNDESSNSRSQLTNLERKCEKSKTLEGIAIGTESTSTEVSISDSITLHQVAVFCARRALIYPYLRMWPLIRKIFADVVRILLAGQRMVLKCLLNIRRIFERTETHYLLNKVFIDDYCVWLSRLENGSSVCKALGNELAEVKKFITKGDLQLGLLDIERAYTCDEDSESYESSTTSSNSSTESDNESNTEENVSVQLHDTDSSDVANASLGLESLSITPAQSENCDDQPK